MDYFSSDRRYILQRYFERELSKIKSSKIETQWRDCLFHCASKTNRSLLLTSAEIQLMHEILTWHCNSPLKIHEQMDCLLDFEDLLETYHSFSLPHDQSPFLIQPVTTLDAARRNIELWTNLQTRSIDPSSNEIPENILSFFTAHTGWIQLDSKLIPFMKKHCDRLLPVEYLLKEHLITSSEDFSLRSLYIPSNPTDLQIFANLLSQSNWILPNQISFITLDHLIFRLKRLFFIRFISSSHPFHPIDYSRIMSNHGGLLTSIHSPQQRIPYLYINKQTYIPQLNHLSSNSTFSMANPNELEYLRLITLYDYLSSEENQDYLRILFTRTNIQLIRVDWNQYTSISLNDFHRHEYQRRTQQEQSPLTFSDDDQSSNGWWQTPISSQNKRSLSHLKYQRTILF